MVWVVHRKLIKFSNIRKQWRISCSPRSYMIAIIMQMTILNQHSKRRVLICRFLWFSGGSHSVMCKTLLHAAEFRDLVTLKHQHSGRSLSSPCQIPRLLPVFPTDALLFIKPPEVYRQDYMYSCVNTVALLTTAVWIFEISNWIE